MEQTVEQSLNKPKVAIFIDFENICISLERISKRINLENFNIFREVGEIYGEVQYIKPYAVWHYLYNEQRAFEEAGIRTIPIFSDLKNATDISLVIDCLAAGFVDDIDIFVIFAGDGGYAPLVNFLIDKLKKEVYIYSVKSSTKEKVYQRLKDKHLFIDDELSDTLINFSDCDFDPKLLLLIDLLNKGIMKLPIVIRSGFVTYAQQNAQLKENNCGELLDKAIELRLVIPYSVGNKSGDTNKPVRALNINYENPQIKKMGIFPK